MPTLESAFPRERRGRDDLPDLCLALPEPSVALTQDAEWCVVRTDDGWQQIRFHDYGEIYCIPGLYERIFYDVLKCNSPATVCDLLSGEMRKAGFAAADLRALDLGAGNGMVGEQLREAGVETVVGVDICEEAAIAAERDRPGVYTDFLVSDMTDLPEKDYRHLRAFRFTGMTCVAALGFGDIPPEAFVQAYNLVARDGWVAFNIKADFLTDRDPSGFARLIRSMLEEKTLRLMVQKRYCHRISTDGRPLPYVAMVGRKAEDVPEDFPG